MSLEMERSPPGGHRPISSDIGLKIAVMSDWRLRTSGKCIVFFRQNNGSHGE